MQFSRGRPLKNRVPAIILLILSIVLAFYTGWHLKQALDAGHELRQQMGDLSLATMTDAHATAGTVSLGEQSLMEAVEAVRKTAHRDEAWLAVECVGILLGLALLRRRPTAL